MTTKDTGTQGSNTYSDEYHADLDAATLVETFSDGSPPYSPGFPFLLPLIDQVNRSTLSGTGFDTTGYTYDLFGAFGSPCHEDSTASPVVTFTWVPDPNLPSDPPPRGPVYLLEQAKAVASAYVGSGTADDGLGDGAVEMNTDPSQGTYQVSQGKRLVQRDGSGGSLTVSGGPSASADASGAAGSAFVTTGLAFAAALDSNNRGVTISSDIDPTYRKGYKYDASGNDTYDQWGNMIYAPIMNLRDDTGTMRGDVGLGDLPPGSNPPWTQSITYNANVSGGWHILGSYYAWYSSLTGASASGTLGQGLDIFDTEGVPSFVVGYNRPINYTDANGTNYSPGQFGQDHIHLTYQDADQSYGGDGATATANYYMTTHPSYENPFQFRPDEYSYQDVPLNQPVPTAYSNLDSPVQVSGQTPGATTDGDIIEGEDWKFAFNAAPGWLQGILQVAGVNQDTLSPQPFNKTIDFYGVWNTPNDGATWDGSPNPPLGADPGTYAMTPRVQAIMRDSYVRADHYAMPGDPSGYTGFAGQRDQHFKAISSTQGQIGLRGTGDFHTFTTPPFGG